MTELCSSLAQDSAAAQMRENELPAVDLRVGQIMAAKNLPSSETHLQLFVDLGPKIGQQTIVAGIASHFDPPALIGKKVVVFLNRQASTPSGIPSFGSLLTATDSSGNLEIISPGPIMQPGSVVR